jgi:hypothetical protein
VQPQKVRVVETEKVIKVEEIKTVEMEIRMVMRKKEEKRILTFNLT